MAPHPELSPEEAALSPMAIRDLSIAKTLVKRADEVYKQLASAGARDPNDLKGPGFQALFALIGVGMTLTAIWFFFWAKNGGFKWRGKDDWEDYKSTVLRRKGPDGKTLSNATKSTRLGGGSVVHGGSFGAESSVGWTEETATNADVNDYRDAEEGKHGLRGGDGRRERKEKKARRDHTNDYNDPDLQGYRHEKAARVGGLNRQADGMYTDYSGSQPSELGSNVGSNVSSTPLVKKTGEKKDPKKEAKAKEMRARERMKNAKAAEREAKATAAADAKARKEAQKAAIKREKEAYKKNKKTRSEIAPSEVPEMAEVTRPLTEYTAAYTEYTAPSEVGTPERTHTQNKPQGRRAPPSAAYSFTTGDDTNTVYSGAYTDATPPRDTTTTTTTNNNNRRVTRTERTVPSTVHSNDQESSYYSDYRPNADPSVYAARTADRTSRSASRPRPAGSRSRPTSQSPVKKTRPQSSTRPSRSGYAPAPASDIFTMTNGEAQGHMSYPCHIPGLSTAGSVAVSDSVSQAGARRERGGRDVMDGYRRGGVRAVGRRDSLSDSD